MNLMEFLLSLGDLSNNNGTRDEADVWKQFGVDIAPLVIDSVGFTRTTQTEGIVHFLTQLARARSITEQALRSTILPASTPPASPPCLWRSCGQYLA